MERIEINVQTGERKVIVFTPEEEAAAIARGAQVDAAEQARRAREMVAFKARPIDEKLVALGLTLAELKAELAKI